MKTPWIEEKQLQRALLRNEAFWRGELEAYPLMWITVSDAKPGPRLPEPADVNEKWTNVNYAIENAEAELSRTHYAGDALPVYAPWLGPDQFAAWLGAELELRVEDFTSWVKPFVNDWSEHSELKIDPDNAWWQLYLKTLRCSVEAGRGKWVTAYPDMHSGIDALAAIRGQENLLVDLITQPEAILWAMGQMTGLFEYVVDIASEIILPGCQGTSNWTMGWSEKRFLCIGQNDVTCMISPEMFDRFCLMDTVETTNYVDYSLYHLDGPGAVRHLSRLLEIEKLNCIQWIQGAGNGYATDWLDVLRQIQDGGKLIQVFYAGEHGGDADLFRELEILCSELDYRRLFFWAQADSAEKADALVAHAQRVCLGKK
jgi:hypothetical protein